jgi:hypothetical protein
MYESGEAENWYKRSIYLWLVYLVSVLDGEMAETSEALHGHKIA